MLKELEVNNYIGGFKVISKKEIKEQQGILYELHHTKCKARLLYFDTEDSNKLFSVTFKTIPDNSTGVFHILEHSVLNGSEKYPVREPFVELIKGSMNTFLNAMTFPDKTMYPVSSRNEKDFMNLTEVYLDAVFKPAIYHNPNIFRQEGWHFELADKNEKASFNGVVYNEMKGCESSVDNRINDELMAMLYPDNCYKYNSGGATVDIPNLTYEDFINYHRKFYSPDNAIFYLEGKMDISKPVSLIEEYLTPTEDFDLSFTEIPFQKSVGAIKKSIYYPVSGDEETSQKTHIVYGKIMCNYDDKEKICAASMIGEYLTSSMESPLRQMILSKKLGQDIRFIIENSVSQPFMYIQIVNTEEEKNTEITNEIKALVSEIIKEGLDKEELEATLNRMEFQYREAIEPKALYHNMNIMNSYLYGGEADLYLSFGKMFKELRNNLKSNYYEELLKELLSFDDFVTLIAKPSKTLAAEELESEAERAQKIQNLWDNNKVDEIIGICKNLQIWQQTPDTKENLDKMPKLSISDVDPLPVDNITIESKIGDNTILLHPAPVSEVSYINLYFPVPNKYQDKIEQLSLIIDIFQNVPTVNHDIISINREAKKYTGSLSYGLTPISGKEDFDTCKLYCVVRTSVLKCNLKNAIDLIKEITLESKINSPDNLKDLFLQILDSARNDVIENGHSYGLKRTISSFSSKGTVDEKLDGISSYQNLKNLCGNFDTKLSEFIDFATKAIKDIFIKNGLIVGLVLDQKDSENIEECLESYMIRELIEAFPDGEKKDCSFSIKSERKSPEFIQIPSAVSYACIGTNLNTISKTYSGQWAVASNISTFEYLWNAVRVQGGAYGVGMKATPNGDIVFYSYRDPSGVKSYEAYMQTVEFLKEFSNSDADLEKFIISTIASGEPLQTPRGKGSSGDIMYLSGITYEDRCERKLEIINTSKKDILELSEILGKVLENSSRCLVAQDSKELSPEEIISL